MKKASVWALTGLAAAALTFSSTSAMSQKQPVIGLVTQ